MRTQKTLKNWGNDSALLCSPNTTKTKAVDELTELVQNKYPDHVQIPFTWIDDLRGHAKSRGCDKLYVYAWYWRGSWSDPSKELLAVFYRPRD